nr:DUF2065 domain-containing protein [uncultured Caldimonas sp.]
MSEVFWTALAVVFVLEGVLPFLSPATWRRVFEQALRLSDGQLRFLGLASLTCGLLLLWLLAP